MEHVLECLEVDGKLPQVCSGFQIETVVTSAAVAGNRTGWTIEEMVDAFGGGMPEFYFAREDDGNLTFPMFHRFDRRSTLYYLVNMNLSRYVDLETGKCDFDNDDQGSAAAGRQRGGVPGVSLGGQAAPLCPDAFGTQGPGDRRCTVRRPGAADGLRSAALGRGYSPMESAPIPERSLSRTRYNFDDSQTGWWSNRFTKIQPFRGKSPREKVAGDCTAGAADRNIYAFYVGFPTAGGTGSSFTLHLSMGILQIGRAHV